ncbi:MAG: hypothetical protein ABIH87_01915 [bacterium]
MTRPDDLIVNTWPTDTRVCVDANGVVRAITLSLMPGLRDRVGMDADYDTYRRLGKDGRYRRVHNLYGACRAHRYASEFELNDERLSVRGIEICNDLGVRLVGIGSHTTDERLITEILYPVQRQLLILKRVYDDQKVKARCHFERMADLKDSRGRDNPGAKRVSGVVARVAWDRRSANI